MFLRYNKELSWGKCLYNSARLHRRKNKSDPREAAFVPIGHKEGATWSLWGTSPNSCLAPVVSIISHLPCFNWKIMLIFEIMLTWNNVIASHYNMRPSTPLLRYVWQQYTYILAHQKMCKLTEQKWITLNVRNYEIKTYTGELSVKTLDLKVLCISCRKLQKKTTKKSVNPFFT